MRVVCAGDSALVVELEERIDAAINAQAIALADAVQAAGVRDVVPTFRSVTVYFDPLRTDYGGLLAMVDVASRRPPPPPSISAAPIRIPVCYGGDFGPDLADVAAYARLSESEVIARHALRVYRVFALG